ncbi:conserved hypothetical protein [Arthrobacter sp. 9AX]|uniref:hypothetical protein n=1 Tax=Arthrobacter sp. 9AX TaxID=2653131 RepID=UPI0012F2BC18|nr:hypothetical protein [Arthrobacter sp. 9AX]VXB99613.1 conserved hypothetical protein [Arthrobacter sp. 9AX]
MQTAPAEVVFLGRVVKAADQYVHSMLETHDAEASAAPHLTAQPQGVAVPQAAALPHREAMGRLLALVTVFSEPGSAYCGSGRLREPMACHLDRLELLQGPTGLFDGTNLCSPPDSAFTLNDVCLALGLIRALDTPGPLLAEVDARLSLIVARATDAMVSGGVHTPNHRWELSAALAQMHQLQPSQDIADRIEEWLAEGIDQLPDGMYSERSPLYATAVTNPSLITIADSFGRPGLLDHVRRNLTAFLPFFNADGSVESVFSRRQDQWLTFHAAPFLRLYRRLANQDGRPDFAAAATWLGTLPLHEPAKLLALTRLDPWLRAALPGDAVFGDSGAGDAGGPAFGDVLFGDAVRLGQQPPSDASISGAAPGLPAALAPVRAALDSCGLHRFRASGSVSTVFGGCDELIPGVVSGLSSNPTFLRFVHGEAMLSGVRLSRSFFDLGPFRSQHTVRNGNSAALSETVAANFYLPLPQGKRREDGIYELQHEGRFSASMDFSSRPTVEHRLGTDIRVEVDGDQAVLTIDFEGADTAFALELTFRPGGVLDGVAPLGERGAFQLVDGMGSYRVGSDVIEFGPGIPADPDTPPVYNPGENYRYLAGTNASDGIKVFITGRTRGRHVFTLRGMPGPA